MIEQVATSLELPEQLIIQIVAVGQHHDRRILHRRIANHATGIKQHRKAFTGTLRMPHDTRSSVPGFAAVHPTGPILAFVFRGHHHRVCHPAGPHRFLYRSVHRMELVVARDDLMHSVTLGILLKHDKVLQHVEEPAFLKHASNQDFQFQSRLGGISFAVDGSPDLEPLLIGCQRSNACL